MPKLGKGRALDQVAAFTGMRRTSLEKAIAIVDAADAEPERFAKLQVDMDRTGRVRQNYKRLQIARQAERIRAEPPPLPKTGPYRVSVIDPPWPYEFDKLYPGNRATHPYPQMSLAEIKALPIGDLMHDNSAVWMWTTNNHLLIGAAFDVLNSWNLQRRQNSNLGQAAFRLRYLPAESDRALPCSGQRKSAFQLTNQSTLLLAPLGEHSEKPDAFYDLVESLCPAPRYLEMFARKQRQGWDTWGDEVPRSSEPDPQFALEEALAAAPTPADDMPDLPASLRRH